MKITFPHLGNTYIVVKSILDELGIEYVIPPFNNKKALELGTRLAPEMVCLPLKINIGNYIQAYEMGADTILMAGGCGPCRFGYYSQLQQAILADAGYDMDIITFEATAYGKRNFLYCMRKLASEKARLIKLPRAIVQAVRIAKLADELEMLSYRIRARELHCGDVDRIYADFRNNAIKAQGTRKIISLIAETRKKLCSVRQKTGFAPLRVGIVGEIYTGIEQFASFSIQERLGRMGVETVREVTVSNWIIEHIIKNYLHLPRDMRFANAAEPWLGAMIGGHARETVGNSVLYAQKGYDGVIQVFPFSCMPEIVAESLLRFVSREYDLPVLTLIIDEMTGEAGYMTRLEAFVDMLWKRRERGKYCGGRVLSWD
ncbi:MAG: CoA protein activase [Bacillota bacterium]